MIETHVVNACMSNGFRSGWFFTLLNTSNGYVSVTFIFCAGAGFWLAASRKWDEYKGFQSSLRKYVKRLAFILLVAYWLHIPEFSLWKLLQAQPERQNILFICDVLHAIVMASLFALTAMLLTPKPQYLRWVFVALAVVFFFGAPFVWTLEPDSFLPRFLGSYLSRPPAAAFPLFPWCGYFFAGAAITAFFMELEYEQRRRFAKIMAIIAVITPAATLFLEFFTPYNWLLNYGWGQNWYLCSPGNALFRVSGSVLMFSLLYLYQAQLESSALGKRIAGWLQLMGQESLFVYVFHLMIVYGSPANLGLSYFVGPSFKPHAVIIVVIMTVIAVYYMTLLWHDFKLREPKRHKRLIFIFAGLFATIFLLTTPGFVDWANAWVKERFPQAAQTNTAG